MAVPCAEKNLFHSFETFSVPANSEAFFNNNASVRNIFSRVTGASISNIDGLLRANGMANLFLLNPNGIVFGPNARLDLGGSFFATTASRVTFENGLAFDAVNPEGSVPLLSVNVPLGLQFGQNPGAIQATGAELNVRADEALVLVGGAIALDSTTIQAPGGRVDLASAGGTGIVALRGDGTEPGFRLAGLDFPADLARSTVLLENDTTIAATASGGGGIAIAASDIELRNSFLRAGIGESVGFLGAQAGDIELNATGRVVVGADSEIATSVGSNAVGNAGAIEIVANTVEVRDGARLSSSTGGEGNAGTVSIEATDAVAFFGVSPTSGRTSSAFGEVRSEGRGSAGDIRITAGTVAVLDGAQLSSDILGEGSAGMVSVEATGTVTFSGFTASNTPDGPATMPGGAFVRVQPGGRGDAGDIRISADVVEVLNGAGAGFESGWRGFCGVGRYCCEFRSRAGGGGAVLEYRRQRQRGSDKRRSHGRDRILRFQPDRRPAERCVERSVAERTGKRGRRAHRSQVGHGERWRSVFFG